MKKLLFLLLIFLSKSALATDIPMDIVQLRGLDKVTGRISTFSIPVGQVGQFGRTFIAPESCYTHPPEESPEDSVFLFIYEKTLKGQHIELFKGWMFSSNPALSSMEHPVYDIWVLGCQKDPLKKESTNTLQIPHPQAINIPISTEKDVVPPIVSDPNIQIVPSPVEMEDI